ncbi:MAG: bacterial Ig-like domain-containing protein [Clostridia bacterium]|nr:bacterial Ig-like domain-containing protein [Clostridia bacterium]
MKRKILLLTIIISVAVLMLTGCTTDLDNGKQLTGIAIGEFTDTEYYLGEPLSLGNAQIVVSYADGWSRSIDITEDMISGYDPKTEGPQTVTITYQGFRTQVEVSVKPHSIQSIDAVEVNPNTGTVTMARPLRVVEGGQPDFSGVSLRVNYETISVINETIVSSMVSGYSPAACPPSDTPYPITITYGGKSTTVLLYVIPKSVQQLLIESDGMPQKLQYYYNNPAFVEKINVFNHGKSGEETIGLTEGLRFTELFDPTGLKITVKYNNGTQEVVPYNQIDSEDIEIEYNFNKASAESPVTVTYLNKQVIFYVKVVEPVTTGMEITRMPSTRGRFSFVSQDATLEAPQGTIVELPQYDISDEEKHYIIRTPEADISQDLIVEGDTVEWNTGRASVMYDDGTVLTNVPLDYNDIVKTCPDFPSLNVALNKTGVFTIQIAYSNSSWTPLEIGVKVVPRAAIRLFLAEKSVDSILQDTYYVGDEIATDIIKYNVFYDNGTFLFGDISYEEWIDPFNWQGGVNIAGEISYETWADSSKWSLDAQQNISYDFAKSQGNGYGWEYLNTQLLAEPESEKCVAEGPHTIVFQIDGVQSKPITVPVMAVLPVSISLIQDYSYYFLLGDSTLGFFVNTLRNEVRAYVKYNNGTFTQKSLSAETVAIYKDDVFIYSFVSSNPHVFQETGEYEIRVTVDNTYASLPLYVNANESDPIVQNIEVAASPADEVYDQFSVFENALNQFAFTLTYSDGSQKTLYLNEGTSQGDTVYAQPKYSGDSRTEDDVLILCDKNKIGNQDITFRYRGRNVKYPITIIGRWEKSIQIIKLPQQFYLYGRDTTIDISGLKVRILYNDGTVVEETDFSNPKWSFVYPQLGLLSGQYYTTKTVTVVLDGVRQKLKRDYTIELADGEITAIDYDEDQQITVGYDGGSPVYESLLKEYTDYEGVSRKMLNVTYGQDLDLTSFILNVHYTYTDASEVVRTVTVQRGITSSNINYDKSVDYLDGGNIIYTRELTISYCGKTVPIWLHLDTERTLEGIEIVELPNQLNYAVGQNIDLRGGLVKRTFLMGNGTYSYDYIYMTNPDISLIYDNGAFPIGSPVSYETRGVTVSYFGYSDAFDVVTYKKLTANLEYVDTVFRYGQTTQPEISVIPSGIPGFELPQISWSYGVTQLVDDQPQTVWTTDCPTVPGTYPIKVTVLENEYYEAYDESERNLNIMRKLITVNGKDFTKYYSQPEPVYNQPNPDDPDEKGYYFFGYSGGTTPLVGDDIIEIRMRRLGDEASENVRFDGTGAIMGYTISFELIDGENQNDYYIFDFVPGKLYIYPLSIAGSVTFTGYAELIYDGNEHGVTAYYLDSNNYKVLIEQKDIIYTYLDIYGQTQVVQKPVVIDGQTVMVNCPPTEAGTYTATISSNFTISGTNSVTFTINP